MLMRPLFMLLGALAAFAVPTADAAVKLGATRLGQFLMRTNVMVPLNDLGQTELKFNLPAAKKLLLVYSANCSVWGPVNQGTVPGVDIDIYVNNVVVAPTTRIHAFCSKAPLTTDTLQNPSLGSIAVQINGKKGANTVSIVANRIWSAQEMLISDSSLVISD